MTKTLMLILLLKLPLVSNAQILNSEKICGVNFVSSKLKSTLSGIDSITAINANWIALCPFAFLNQGSSKIEFNSSKSWWGDTREGLIKEISKAKQNKLKVFVKPHFWLMEKGWAGDFDLKGKLKEEWEENYNTYMFYLAKLCDSLNVEMLAIGTELKTYTLKHNEFFVSLIKSLRKNYKGKLTYAANWDEYSHIKFWNELDFIGIDGYFPLSADKTPSASELTTAWNNIIPELKTLSKNTGKKVVFTEYGYKSIDHTAYKQWEFENTPKDKNINLNAQVNAYAAFFNAVWNQEFVSGGFLWKWYDTAPSAINSDYTPQGKPVLNLIKNEYSKK